VLPEMLDSVGGQCGSSGVSVPIIMWSTLIPSLQSAERALPVCEYLAPQDQVRMPVSATARAAAGSTRAACTGTDDGQTLEVIGAKSDFREVFPQRADRHRCIELPAKSRWRER